MYRPTILIKKKKIFDSKGWNRYYGRTKIDLNNIPIMNEKQLCYFIYRNFGEGKYMILAWKKGRKGFWVFWIGEINKDGFIFRQRNISDTREINKLKREYEETDNYEDRKWLEEEIMLEKEINKDTKYGFTPYLKPSGRRGEFIFWEDG